MKEVLKKVKMKTRGELRLSIRRDDKFAHMSTVLISPQGELLQRNEEAEDYTSVFIDYDEFGEEFLVVDHPNVISKAEYEFKKSLFDDVLEEKEEYSFKGVF